MSKWIIYAGFALDGMGVVLLGPLVPRLESLWGIGDTQGGALLGAMFFGMTAGTVFVLHRRWHAMLAGSGCAGVGLATLALLIKFHLDAALVEALALVALCLYGFGLGQAITTLNISAGAQAAGRTSRLAFGNAAWSAGAILSPVLMAVALRGSSLPGWLAGLVLLFPLLWLPGAYQPDASLPVTRTATSNAASQTVIVFGSLMFLYGSVESCLSGWVTSFAARHAHATLSVSTLTVSAFWFGVATGRVLAGLLLSRLPERRALTLMVGGALLACLGLLLGQSMLSISVWAGLCGACVGPVFASIVGGLLSRGASKRQTGTVLAMCGAGATVMPFVLGLVSQQLNSLRDALLVPGACLAAMFLLASFRVRDVPFSRPAIE